MASIFDNYGQSTPTSIPPKHFSGLKKLISQGTFVTGSGLSSFDGLLGGGLPMGCSVLFLEDIHRTYIRYFLKLFASQGATNHHSLHLISPIDRIASFIQDLPAIYDYSSESIPNQATGDAQLDIAWRYKNLPSDSQLTHNKASLSNAFDINRIINTKDLVFSTADVPIDPKQSLEFNLVHTLKHISGLVANGSKVVNRIMIDSLGSPLWGRRPDDLKSVLAKFMAHLRMILRQSFNVAYISVPKSVARELEPDTRWLNYADCIFDLEGFDGLEGGSNVTSNPAYQDYSGLLRVMKLPSLSRMNLEPMFRPLTTDWAFKVKRRQFIVQHLNLPACLGESVSRSNMAESQHPCRSVGGNNALDF